MTERRKGARVSVSFPGNDYAELHDMAAKYDVSLAWLIRHATADFLERYRSGQTQLPLPLHRAGGQ